MMLEPSRLTMERAFKLAPLIRNADRLECGPSKDPLAAMLVGISPGNDAWVATDPHGNSLGVYGYTEWGVIWSLWRDMTRAESVAVLRHTPMWVAMMVHASEHPYLFNFVSVENKEAIGWLEASKCFDIDYRAVPMHEGTAWSYPAYGFKTKAHFH